MKMLFIHTLLFTGLVIGASCKKSTIPIFSSISASVNGQPYRNSSCTSCIGGGSGINEYLSNGILNIGSEMVASSGHDYLDFVVQNVTTPGSYSLSLAGPTSNYARFETILSGQSSTTYVTDTSHGGTVVVTKLDTAHHIIYGTFQFDVVNTANSTDVVHVTNGQFTILYTTP
jgi:hypothetical protein